MKEENKLIEIQEILIKQMRRLDDNELMKKDCLNEIARSNAISTNATTYIKAVNTNLRIAESRSNTIELYKKLGISDDNK